MNKSQVNWAMSHDWFVSYEPIADNNDFRVWVRSARPEGGIIPFSNYCNLRNWAGY